MARLNPATKSTGKTLRAGTRGRWAVAALFATVACSAVILSGCAGMATNSSAKATPQDMVQITPSDMTFSNVAAGEKATQTATLVNTGTEAVTISQMAMSSAEFSTSSLAVPMSLGPGQSTKFQVTYAGKTAAGVSGTLTAMTSTGGRFHVKLKGSGGATPTLSLSTTALSFGNVLVNGSATQAVTLKNSGQTNIQISQMGVTGGGFTISGMAAPVTISAGQSVALQAKFAPATEGAVKGAISITSDAQNPTATVALNGTGVAATYTMALSPTTVSFGNVNAGSSATQTVQLSNTGNSSVTISQITASGSGISVSGAATPVTLAPSQGVALTVKFAPTTSGTTTGSLTVTSSDGVNAGASITGTGVQAGLTVTPSSASFGSVVVGSTNSQTVQVRNSGTGTLTISQATVSGTGFSLTGMALPMNLAPGQSGNFNVQYAPQGTGSVTGAVSILSNAPNSPTIVALSATGTTATATMSVSPGSLSFGSLTTGSVTTQPLTITNTGNANVSISSVSATAGGAFSIASGAGAVTLSPTQSTSVSVQFAPTSAGSKVGSVTIASNATGSVSSVSLTGTAVAPTANHSIALNWAGSSSSVSGYNVYRSTVKGASYAKMNGSLVGGVSFSDSSVQSGLTYYYVATSVDASGNESVYSNEVSAIVP